MTEYEIGKIYEIEDLHEEDTSCTFGQNLSLEGRLVEFRALTGKRYPGGYVSCAVIFREDFTLIWWDEGFKKTEPVKAGNRMLFYKVKLKPVEATRNIKNSQRNRKRIEAK